MEAASKYPWTGSRCFPNSKAGGSPTIKKSESIFVEESSVIQTVLWLASFQSELQIGKANRFGDVVIHTGIEARLPIFFHCAGRHRHNAGPRLCGPFRMDPATRFKAVQFRHMHVHENHVVWLTLQGVHHFK